MAFIDDNSLMLQLWVTTLIMVYFDSFIIYSRTSTSTGTTQPVVIRALSTPVLLSSEYNSALLDHTWKAWKPYTDMMLDSIRASGYNVIAYSECG
jgi:hypothetical protein